MPAGMSENTTTHRWTATLSVTSSDWRGNYRYREVH